MSRRVITAMGTVVSLEIPDDTPDLGALLRAIESTWERLEDRFSLYRQDSELSRLNRARRSGHDAPMSLERAHMMQLAHEWERRTGGIFTPLDPATGDLDLNGVVKARAIEETGALLGAACVGPWVVDAGGDLLTSDPIHVGIAHPHEPGALVADLEVGYPFAALATSGVSERGEHIWTGNGGVRAFDQVSVMAPDIMTADVLATTILAGGEQTLASTLRDHPIEVLVVEPGGTLRTSAGWPRHRAVAR